MQKSKISRGWFAAPPIQLHAQTLVELQGLSTSPFERIKFSEILARYRQNLRTTGNESCLERLDALILNWANGLFESVTVLSS